MPVVYLKDTNLSDKTVNISFPMRVKNLEKRTACAPNSKHIDTTRLWVGLPGEKTQCSLYGFKYNCNVEVVLSFST